MVGNAGGGAAGGGRERRVGLRQYEDGKESNGTHKTTEQQRSVEIASDNVDTSFFFAIATLSKGTNGTPEIDDGQDEIPEAHVVVIVADEHL